MTKQRRYSDPIMNHFHIKESTLNNSLRDYVTRQLNPEQLEMTAKLFRSYEVKREGEEMGKWLLKKLHRMEVGRIGFEQMYSPLQEILEERDLLKRKRFDPDQIARDADVTLDHSQAREDYEGPSLNLSDPDSERTYIFREKEA